MEGQDTNVSVTTAQGATAQAAMDTAHTAAAGAEAAKPNVFSQMFGFLGNHHSIDVMPFGKIQLPYMFWDQGSFHVYGTPEAVKESGVYTVIEDEKTESSPLAEKGAVTRVDHKPISFDLSITSNLCFFAVAAVILTLILQRAASAAKKSLIPKGIRNLVEVLVVFIRDDVVVPNIAEPYGSSLMPYFLTVFLFIMLVNLFGLVPWGHTATSSLEITAGLSIVTFIITQYVGIKSQGLKAFLLHLTGGLHEMELSVFMKIFLLIIMVPIEIMGLFTKPFALAIRLFANMTAGHIVIFSLIGLVFLFHSILVGAFVTVPFSVFVYLLEIFVAVLQAYIFTALSAVFIGMMAHSEHEAHVHDKDLPHAADGDHLVGTSHAV